jgi:hypothetical protein
MMERVIRYGINMGLTTVDISPFGPTAFVHQIGNVNVQYSSTAVRLCLPGSGTRVYTVTGLQPAGTYSVSVAGTGCGPSALPATVADAAGTVTFTAPIGTACTIALDMQ